MAENFQEPQLYEELALNKFESVAICGKVVFLGFDLCLVEIPVFVLSMQEKKYPHNLLVSTFYISNQL